MAMKGVTWRSPFETELLEPFCQLNGSVWTTVTTTTTTTSTGWTCHFLPGDGVGGVEEFVGKPASEAECADLVRSARPSANGATYGTNTNCYAEFGMNARHDASAWRSCIFSDGDVTGR
eukprot:TRINITY_DN4892_c0_g1_i13.p1 TRINITY_DN4892_c0_g1~~TRINITY_DN4892_c0_g1_i13.p1  ORF type:complete len:119 (-),score=1.33 TRINITY_DN4892_c0_g1_i13:222-578(-)